MAGKKIAGVCSGMAEYLNADPVMVRLVWVIITLGLPPAGIIGYIVAWIVIPKAHPRRPDGVGAGDSVLRFRFAQSLGRERRAVVSPLGIAAQLRRLE